LTADIAIGQSLALCAQVKTIELADIVIKAWATALHRANPDAPADIALAAGKDLALIRDAAPLPLSAIAAARGENRRDARSPATAIVTAQVPGIASAALAVRPPQTTMLSIGSRRRA